MTALFGFTGTYTSPENPGVYRFCIDTDTGKLSDATLIFPQSSTKYAACCENRLASFTESDQAAGTALLIDGTLSDTCLNEQTTACYMVWHEDQLFTANYHDGHVLIYSVENGELVLNRRLFIASEAGCHQALFYGPYLLVPCLRLDMVQIFDRDRNYATCGTIPFPKDSGPRHGVFSPCGRYLYFVSETSNQLFTFAVDDLNFQLLSIKELLPKQAEGSPQAAALRLSPDGTRLIVSVRGTHHLVSFRLIEGLPTLESILPSPGKDPWDIRFLPGGRFLLVSNRSSDLLAVLPYSSEFGLLPKAVSTLHIPQCVGLALETEA